MTCAPGGADDQAPILVMLHGFMGCGRDLEGPARAVARQAGLRVLLPDLPGHGSAVHVPPISLAYAASFVWDAVQNAVWSASHNDVRGVLQHGPRSAAQAAAQTAPLPRVLVAGYSLGGRVALAMAHQHPSAVHGLFLESAHPGLVDGAERRVRARHDTDVARRLQEAGTKAEFRAFLEAWYRQPVFQQNGQPPRDMEDRIAQKLAPDAGPHAEPLAAALRAFSLSTQPDMWPVCARFGPRAWYVSGADDERYTRVGQRLAGRCPGLRHVNVPDAGHTVHRDQPDTYLLALQQFVTTCLS